MEILLLDRRLGSAGPVADMWRGHDEADPVAGLAVVLHDPKLDLVVDDGRAGGQLPLQVVVRLVHHLGHGDEPIKIEGRRWNSSAEFHV